MLSFSRVRSYILYPIAIVLLSTSGCHGANDNPTLLIIGDSLSAGYGVDAQQSWVSLLEARLKEEDYGYRVINASISGDTTTGGLGRLPQALAAHQPGIVLIELGGNDGLRGTPINVMRKNLSKMIELSQDVGAHVILAGMQIPPNYGPAYTTDFSSIYPQLADEYDAGLIGFFMQNVALNSGLMQADGIHPNADGQPVLLDNVWPALKPLLNGSAVTSD